MTTEPTPEARIELSVLAACAFFVRGLSGDGATAAELTAAEFGKKGWTDPTPAELARAERAAHWFGGIPERRERTVTMAIGDAMADKGNGH